MVGDDIVHRELTQLVAGKGERGVMEIGLFGGWLTINGIAKDQGASLGGIEADNLQLVRFVVTDNTSSYQVNRDIIRTVGNGSGVPGVYYLQVLRPGIIFPDRADGHIYHHRAGIKHLAGDVIGPDQGEQHLAATAPCASGYDQGIGAVNPRCQLLLTESQHRAVQGIAGTEQGLDTVRRLQVDGFGTGRGQGQAEGLCESLM